MGIPIPPEVRELLDAPNLVHLALLRADGTPHVIPVWVGLEGDRILVGTGGATYKARVARRNPVVALSVVDRDNPYRVASLRGRVVEQRPDEDVAVMDALAQKYIRGPFVGPYRESGRVVLVIELSHARHRVLPFREPGR